MREKIDSMNILSRNPMFSDETLISHLEFYLRSSQKNVEANLTKLDSFVNTVPIVDTIIIAGCSLGNADSEYYERILIPRFKDKKWLIYWYSEEDKLRAHNFAERYGLDCSLERW